MTNFSFLEVSKELDEVKEEGITFADKQLSWDSADDVKEVVKALKEQKIVHYLKLEGNTLGVDAAKAIGDALKQHPEFRKALWKNMFTRRLKTEIPEALKHLGSGLIFANAQLSVLDLSDNALGPNGMVGLEDLLRSPVCYTLQELYLNNCGLGIGGGRMLSKALIDCHERSHAAGKPLKLKTFVAGRNRLENDGASAIAKMLGTLGTLEEIAMPQNSIYHIGIKALAEGFKKNPQLRIINLNDNTLEHRGAGAIADAISVATKLQELNLGDCLLRSRGALLIADVLDVQHNMLEAVDLSYNEIRAPAGIELATALRDKPHLKSLNLDGNQFGQEGIGQIKEIMDSSSNPMALTDFDEDQSDNSDEEEGEEGVTDEEATESGEEEGESYDGEDYEEEYDGDPDYIYDGSDDVDDISKYLDMKQTYIGETADSEAYTRDFAVCDSTFQAGKTVSEGLPNAEKFCLSRQPCSLQMFETLQEANKLKAFMDIINQFTDDNHILLLMFTTLKCAHLSKASPAALEVAMDLYKESFDYAVQKNLEKRVLKYFLIQLGLLDPEEEFKPLYDAASCRFALRETLSQRKITSDIIKDGFKTYLSKPGV